MERLSAGRHGYPELGSRAWRAEWPQSVDVDVDVDALVDGDDDVDLDVLHVDAQIIFVSIATTPFEKADSVLVAWRGDDLSELHDVKRGGAFHRFAASDLVMRRAVGLRPAPGSLRDVSQNGFGRADKLVSALRMALRQVADDVANEREEFDGTLIDVEALEVSMRPVRPLPAEVVYEQPNFIVNVGSSRSTSSSPSTFTSTSTSTMADLPRNPARVTDVRHRPEPVDSFVSRY
jgi:hypothetical protein